ncbi:hypothetical protein [Bacillus toyonensis]|uniref:hypothetical protein n=1 Tax=Bacillus toyonensis TaxID=155322 RepID=UPI002E1FDB5E|nr:hypothetical protein [Bacillus toyonensis]
MKLRAIKELEYRTKKMNARFQVKSEKLLEKSINKTNASDFESDVKSMLPPANELMFITVKKNAQLANEIFKIIQILYIEGTKVIENSGTNNEIMKLVTYGTEKILMLLKEIEQKTNDFKSIIYRKRHSFNENWFAEVSKNIQINDNFSVFIEELNGGDTALSIKKALQNPLDKDIHLYGIDNQIDIGISSRKRGIHTARGGLLESSSYWADLSFCTNQYINFAEGTGYYTESELFKFYHRKMMRKDGYFVFNYPFYRIDDIRGILRNNELIQVINTYDEIGNIVFVMKFSYPQNYSSKDIKNIAFRSSSIPNFIEEPLTYFNKGFIEVKKFRGNYTDISDISAEFINHPITEQFVFDYYKPKNRIEEMSRPLTEYKAGHIPAMATSEIINGRYIDEVLRSKQNKSFEFDHIFSTKIVKREIEEEKEVIYKGEVVKEICLKKSNVIVSTVLTAEGQYIELFSNDVDDVDLS